MNAQQVLVCGGTIIIMSINGNWIVGSSRVEAGLETIK